MKKALVSLLSLLFLHPACAQFIEGFEQRGLYGGVTTFETFDDGGGEALYAGGNIFLADGLPAGYVAKWDGTSWSPLGLSTTIGGGFGKAVLDLQVFDDGGGPALYLIGTFEEIAGLSTSGIARWNGTSWSAPPDSGLEVPWAATVFDDGGGPKLFIGGDFVNAGSQVVNHIATWDGTSFGPVPGLTQNGVGPAGSRVVQALAAVDAGDGEKLYVGGNFTTAGGAAIQQLASWDGSRWAPYLGAQGLFTAGVPSGPSVLTAITWQGRPALFVGGEFSRIGSMSSSCAGVYIAMAEVFSDSFESGDTSSWAQTQP